ncbi:MAG: nucleotide-binding universal stress UspA family protein [Natronomonas sp.]|jgi:nucleotide-binding universal stress UspA family protein
MYDQILFPTDGSETASVAFEYALSVASAHDATLHVLHVADSSVASTTTVGGEVVDVLEQEGEQFVDELRERAETAGVSVVTDVQQGGPADMITAYAEEYDIELIVMPTHGRSGLKRHLLGSVTERVLSTALTPVLTVTPSEGEEFVYPPSTLLFPTDGSRCAELALDEATGLVDATGATLHLLTVVETTALGIDVRSTVARDQLEAQATEILDGARATAEEAGIESVSTSVAYGRPYKEIHSYLTEEGIDLVVLGTRGETDFSKYVLGGVSDKLIRTAPVPVLVVPERD